MKLKLYAPCLAAALLLTVNGQVLSGQTTAQAPSSTSQAKVTMKGRIVDEKGEPVIGAGIIEEGVRSNGVMSSADGTFTINLKNPSSSVRVSCIGYLDNVLKFTSDFVTVTLAEDTERLDEVVVVGYGTAKKRDLTGSISHVNKEELTAYPVTDPVFALQGRVPGVVISQNTGSPEGDYSIRIRGVNSIKGDNNPLYIIDGIPASTASINTYDIESLEVLKDASATAIYGSRGANGVVLITTKKGKSGKAKVTYDFQYGMQYQIKRLDLMNAQEWMQFYNEYLVNAKILAEAPFSEADIAAAGKGTDWQKEVFKPAPTQNHNITVSGGSEKTRYFISGSAMLKDGLVDNSYYNKYNIRGNIDTDLSDKFSLTMQMGYSIIDKMNQTDSGGVGGSSLIGAAFSASPTFTIYDEDGNYKDLRSWYSWSSHEIKNPVMMANEATYKTVTNLTDINTSLKYKPFAGFTLTANVGAEMSDSRYDAYTTKKYNYTTNSASVTSTRSSSVINEEIANYRKEFGNHMIDVMGAFSYQQSVSKNLHGAGSGFLTDLAGTNDLGAANVISTPTTSSTKWVLMSWLGRVNYSFKDRYMLTASFRADGSSRYSPGQKWGYFPSGAFAWRISDEPFMKNVRAISDLKLRLGYGKTGSTAISAYSTQNLLSSGKTAVGGGTSTNYAPGTTYPGNLKWESTAQYNAGLDIGLLDQKLRITADYYYKFTDNLLNNVTLPSSSGYNQTVKNIGSMINSGVEFNLEADIIRTYDWGLTAQFNIAHNSNKVHKLADGNDIIGTTINQYGSGAVTIIREGEPIGSFWLYESNGIGEDGTLSYVDQNGDGKFTDLEDRIIAGSPFADFTYGLNVGLRYRRWDFNFFLQGSQGNDVYNLSEMRNMSYSQGMNIDRRVWKNSWKEGQDNSKATYPKITNTNAGRHSTQFLEDGSYLRLKNITLAYNIPVEKLKIHKVFSSFRVFVTAQNFLTITGYSGMDPEVSSKGTDIDASIDHLSYPNVKTVSGGLSLSF